MTDQPDNRCPHGYLYSDGLGAAPERGYASDGCRRPDVRVRWWGDMVQFEPWNERDGPEYREVSHDLWSDYEAVLDRKGELEDRISSKTVHNVARRRGLDLRDLGSVVAFVTRRRAPHSRVRRWAQDAAERDLDRCAICGAGVGRQCSQPSGKVRAPHRGRKARTP